MTEKYIQRCLDNNYANNAQYVAPNVFLFGNRYGETDFLVVRKGKGYVYDIEVKISRADFFRDMKKEHKHRILEHGVYLNSYTTYIPDAEGSGRHQIPAYTPIHTFERPNRFYFAVPENMVTKDEVPSYAGLLYITQTGAVKKIKEGKLLHPLIIDVEPALCRKFYFHSRDYRIFKDENGISNLRTKNQQLERKLDELQDKYDKLQYSFMVLNQEIKIPK